MEKSKTEESLYIGIFKEEITRLCDTYTHPIYLNLLSDFEKPLLEGLREALNTVINNHQPSSSNGKNTSTQVFNLKEDLKKKIASILGEKQEGSSENATLSKQPSPEELTTLEKKLLTTLADLLTSTDPSIEPIEKESIEKLRGKLKDCFNEYRNLKKEFIRSIINREEINREDEITQENPEKGETNEGEQESIRSHWALLSPKDTKRPLEKRCAQLDKIIGNLWIPLSKSLLEGEFLKDIEYSKKLREIVEKIRNTYDSTLSEDVIYLHPILSRIHELCQELSYVCQCIRIQIEEREEPHNKHRVFHAPVSYLARKPYAGGVNSGEMLKANLFHDLGTKLIEMTRVDLSGVIDDQAVSHLFLLYKQCNLLLNNEESNLLDFPMDKEIKKIFEAIRAKTSLLLFQSFYKPHVTSKTCKIGIAKSIADPYQRAESFEILYEGERYQLMDTEESSEIKLLHEQIKGFESLSFDALSEECPQSDILKYDNYIRRGEVGRQDADKYEKDRTKFFENLLQNPDKDQQKEQILHLPLDVLLSFMKELRRMKELDHKKKGEGPRYNNSRYAKAMGFLLKCFYERLLIYKDFVAAEQKKDTYANSFYKLKETDLKIFISSFGCKLLHTQALQDEAYHKYNQTYREWLSEAQEEAMDEAVKLKKEAQSTTQEAQNTTQEARKATQEAQEARKEAQEARKEAISILSIFVALITFISGGISILKGTNSLADYLILTGTLYIFIASIISFLYFKAIEGTSIGNLSSNNTDQNQKRDKSPKALKYSIGFAVGVIVAGIVLKCTGKETSEDSGSPEINYGVENIRQIFLSGDRTIAFPFPSDSVGFNASTNEKQGKTDSSTDNKQENQETNQENPCDSP